MSIRVRSDAVSDVASQIRDLHTGLEQLGNGNAAVSTWAEVDGRFQSLRGLYVSNPDTLRDHVPQLAELRKQYEARLSAELPRLVDRFHQLGEQVRSAEAERESLRQFFVHRAGTGSLHLSGATAEISVRTRSGLALPKAGTDVRTRLDELVRQTGHWEEVSQLAGPRLLRALQEKRFTDQVQRDIERLCPPTTTHYVQCHPRAGSTAGRPL